MRVITAAFAITIMMLCSDTASSQHVGCISNSIDASAPSTAQFAAPCRVARSPSKGFRTRHRRSDAFGGRPLRLRCAGMACAMAAVSDQSVRKSLAERLRAMKIACTLISGAHVTGPISRCQ